MKSSLVFKRVLKYVRKHGFFIALSILASAICVALTLYVPILIGRSVDLIISAGNVDFEGLKSILGLIVAAVLINALSQWIMNVLCNRITYVTVRNIRKDLFAKIQILPISYIDSHSHGDLVSRMISDVDTFSEGLLMGFSQLFTGVLTIIGTLVFMLSINWKIAIIVVILTPLSLFVAAFVSKKTYGMFRLMSKERGEQTDFINETIGNEKTIKALHYEEKANEKFALINERLKKSSLSAIFFSSVTNPSTRFVNSVIYAVVALFGGMAVISGMFTVGYLTSFLSYANQYTKPFNEISGVITELQNALACAGRVFEMLDESDVVDISGDELEETDGTVDIKNVFFSYTEDKPLIENLNLSAGKGDRIAIVGPTGCGKTTIINLIMRFYDVKSGEIIFSGRNIKELNQRSYRKNIGMVLQDTWLKEGTILDNITFGKENASREEAVKAAKAAMAHSFIRRLPDGYDTYITENGGNLSQGQKQLLCIARVMLALPEVLILDEATSSIDTRTEMKIQKAFNTMMEGRTSFIVAHRLSTIKEADLILVMKDGHIMEVGSHDELLSKKGFYHTLYFSQFEGNE